MSFDWKGLVGKVAPVIGSALGGPFGGVATKFLADKLLGKEDATEEELEAAIVGASPETLARLKEIDANFKTEMKRLGIAEEELHVRDRESARGLAQKSMLPHILLSLAYSIAYFVTLYVYITGNVQLSEDLETLGISLLSILSAAQMQIMNFWFGSSSGSKEKTERLNHR